MIGWLMRWLAPRSAASAVPQVPSTQPPRQQRSQPPRPIRPAALELGVDPQPMDPGQLVFDPALMHFTKGVRTPDPAGLEAEGLAAWLQARHDALDHLVRLVVARPGAAGLVLRGSVSMRAWFGDAAREPRDIDWVVRDPTISPGSAWAEDLFATLLREATAQPVAGDAILEPARAVRDEIWTYERAEGRRLTIPWRTATGQTGSAQMDIVFHEPLPEEPTACTLTERGGHSIDLPCATRSTSLAWKLLWLAEDMNPQGKDLYDAVLLAESTVLPPGLVARVFTAAGHRGAFVENNLARLDWVNFLKEYPRVPGSATEWWQRLHRALSAMPNWDAPVTAPQS